VARMLARTSDRFVALTGAVGVTGSGARSTRVDDIGENSVPQTDKALKRR